MGRWRWAIRCARRWRWGCAMPRGAIIRRRICCTRRCGSSLFRGIFANDLPASEAAVLAATQEPIAASALTEPSGPPAWATIPSWDVIGTADHAIPPAAQEFMAARAHATVTKIDASHLSMISQPDAVTNVIEEAARATS